MTFNKEEYRNRRALGVRGQQGPSSSAKRGIVTGGKTLKPATDQRRAIQVSDNRKGQ